MVLILFSGATPSNMSTAIPQDYRPSSSVPFLVKVYTQDGDTVKPRGATMTTGGKVEINSDTGSALLSSYTNASGFVLYPLPS